MGIIMAVVAVLQMNMERVAVMNMKLSNRLFFPVPVSTRIPSASRLCSPASFTAIATPIAARNT